MNEIVVTEMLVEEMPEDAVETGLELVADVNETVLVVEVGSNKLVDGPELMNGVELVIEQSNPMECMPSWQSPEEP